MRKVVWGSGAEVQKKSLAPVRKRFAPMRTGHARDFFYTSARAPQMTLSTLPLTTLGLIGRFDFSPCPLESQPFSEPFLEACAVVSPLRHAPKQFEGKELGAWRFRGFFVSRFWGRGCNEALFSETKGF